MWKFKSLTGRDKWLFLLTIGVILCILAFPVGNGALSVKKTSGSVTERETQSGTGESPLSGEDNGLPASAKAESAYERRLEERVKELLGDTTVDEGRLLTEVTIFADKVCVDEELVRLRSHIETTKNTLTAGGSIGRKLDFLAQEMNREANTILSKSNDLEISNCAIELKTEIEKVREQIQNIE